MRFSKMALACAAGVLATGALAAPAMAVPVTQTIMLDSHESPSVGFAGPVSSSATVASTYYLSTVSGTYSLWKPSFWAQSVCKGTAVSAPAFPTPDVTNSKTGVDAETIFAAAKGAGACKATLGKHFDVFQISTSGTWSHVEATRGASNSPASDHTYQYALKSSSTGAAIQFRIRDYHTADNYGRLQIQLRRAYDNDCYSFGWTRWDDFNNQNQCTNALPNS